VAQSLESPEAKSLFLISGHSSRRKVEDQTDKESDEDEENYQFDSYFIFFKLRHLFLFDIYSLKSLSKSGRRSY